MKSFALLLWATLAIANILHQDLMQDEDLELEEAVAPTGVFDSMMGRKELRERRRGIRRRWEHDDADAKTEFCWEGICVPVCTGGNRRISEAEAALLAERFRICYSIGDKLTTMITQTLHLLFTPGTSNDAEIESMMEKVYQLCEDAGGANEFAITQCKGYVGMVIRIYEEEGSTYLANQMLVASFGDEYSKKEGCGVVVNMINAKIKAGKITGLSTTPLLSQDSPWPSEEFPEAELDVVVAYSASQLFSPVGAAVGFMVTVGTQVLGHYAFELCRDYYMVETI